MPITDLFLGAILTVLLERLASRELLNFVWPKEIDTLLKKWEKWLKCISPVLEDAEDRQLNDDPSVKLWLEDLRNLAYDVDDLLDEFATNSTENKSQAELGCSKPRSLLLSCCSRLSSRAFMFDRKMGSKIEEMDRKFQDIITLKDGLRLKTSDGERSADRRQNKPLPTSHLTKEKFFGREDKKMEILELLTGEEEDRTCTGIEVIPIVGMPGLGKTALAQQVFNDATVTNYFDVKAWACVSVDFDVPAITKSILQTVNCNLNCEGKDLGWLQHKLKEDLAGKKFLIVLDDVWNYNYGNWTILLTPFPSEVKGSKIIITTRDFRVAEIACARPQTLKELSRDDCMKLFALHAFGVENFDGHPNLEELGLQIVEKCQGLPLAVKTLAGLLRSKASPHEWKAILNSKIWNLRQENNDILPALKLSYLHLSFNLRRCFAYCAIFPHDYEIERDELIHWWIAEGLLQGEEGQNRWDTGLKYFNELVARSLFQKASSSESRFLIHDLVNDLAKLVAGATHFSSGESEIECDHKTTSLARHASFTSISIHHIVPERFKIYHEMKGLRSFISLGKRLFPYGNYYLSDKVLCDLLSTLKYLRVLSLSHNFISEVPDCIGKLRHLRHLNLSYTLIKRLPESIVALYNLEALILRGCDYLIELPKSMEKLINLRFLDISNTTKLSAMPLYIGNLVGLEKLSKFVVGMENGSRLKELKNLKNLEGELCICDLHKVQEAGDAKDANLGTKKGIRRLILRWSIDFENFRIEEREAEVLHFLRPHENLANLEISYYGGLEFPSWLGSPSYVDMVHLRLNGCRSAKELPSLGQLSSLKELYIEGLHAIRSVGSEFYGTQNPFPSLITLEFNDMPLWEDWSHCVGTEEVGVLFPCLQHLVIWNCPKLIGRLPSQLSSLIKFEIGSCPHMDASPSTISLPSLNELKFRDCNEGLLKSLVNLTSLTALAIEDVAELTCLNHEFTSSLIKLEKLEMRWCEKLTYLWQDRDVIQNLACLKSLVVDRCSEFIYFVDGEGDIELLGNLETIELTNCVNLEKLPNKMHTLSSLRDLTVRHCPKLISFPETGIPSSMISLTIAYCEMLQSLPIGSIVNLNEPSRSNNNHNDMKSCLRELRIGQCDSSLSSPFSEGRFLSATLKTLVIWECRGVESLAEINVDGLQSLQEISIRNCENLRSLPKGLNTLSHLTYLELEECPALELECFPPLPLSISRFTLGGCPKIKSLPNQLCRLTCLRDLKIIDCESIRRFPDGGLPPQLKTLRVRGCENMKQPVREWLTPLTSLEMLRIDGRVGGVGEEEDLVLPLPSSLLELRIFDMGNVERLSSSLPPSLLRLDIKYCPKLRELPQDGLPPSLQTLWLDNCPNLRELPQDGLPPSLERLHIRGCGILEKRCTKGSGRYWPLIREIPEITLGGRWI